MNFIHQSYLLLIDMRNVFEAKLYLQILHLTGVYDIKTDKMLK